MSSACVEAPEPQVAVTDGEPPSLFLFGAVVRSRSVYRREFYWLGLSPTAARAELGAVRALLRHGFDGGRSDVTNLFCFGLAAQLRGDLASYWAIDNERRGRQFLNDADANHLPIFETV